MSIAKEIDISKPVHDIDFAYMAPSTSSTEILYHTRDSRHIPFPLCPKLPEIDDEMTVRIPYNDPLIPTMRNAYAPIPINFRNN